MSDPVLAGKRVAAGTRDACSDHGHQLTVYGGLHMIRGNRAPYFSLTYASKGLDGYRRCESGGAGHDVILRHWPRFADLASLHLSDIDGVPMGAEANGWYNLTGALGGYGETYHVGNSERHFPITPPVDKPWKTTEYRKPTQDECVDLFADYIRVSRAEAERIIADVRAHGLEAREAGNRTGTDERRGARARWAAIVETMRPRWKQEAEACIAKHNLRVYGDAWPVAS